MQDSDFVIKYKPNAKLINNTEQRVFVVSAIRYVDKVITYADVDKDIRNIDFDILIKGPDQIHDGFKRAEQYCKENNKEIVTIPRTEGISSSLLRELIKS